MLKHYLYIVFVFCSFVAIGQNVKTVNFDAVQALMNRPTDTTYVINFWATWCDPCVHELPNFGMIDSEFSDKKIKVYLVSMDAPKTINSRLIPFVNKNRVRSDVWLLNAPDGDAWIDKVDPSWSGSIPATLVLNNKFKMRKFTEQELSLDELNNILVPYLIKTDKQ